MVTVVQRAPAWQAKAAWTGRFWCRVAVVLGLGLAWNFAGTAVDSPVVRAAETAAAPAPLAVPDAAAGNEKEMKPYTEQITGTTAKIELVPIPGGAFRMGSAESEAGRAADEGPVHEVSIAPFWMGKYEIGWEEFEIFSFKLDIERRRVTKQEPTPLDQFADGVTRPTAPYTDMSFGMGKEGYPAISMTQLAAKKFCEWISAKTGRYYRLPTEAEWEYACRAGTTTRYSFGDDDSKLGDYAWYYDNSDGAYHKRGQKKPNPWGLYDMHGNVCEIVLDQYNADFYKQAGPKVSNPLLTCKTLYPRGARGGSWDDDPEKLRSAARRGSSEEWKQQDPQIPQSMWYFTDAQFLGFRVVRPLVEPLPAEKAKYGADEHQVWEDN